MATRIKVKARLVRGEVKYCVDLRRIKKGRQFFSTKSEAEKFAEKITIQADNQDPPIILNGKEKRDYQAAQDILAGRFSMVEAAQACIKQNKTLIPMRFEDAIDECFDAKEKSGKDNQYLVKFRNRLKALARFCRDKGKEFCHDISASEAEHWLHQNQWASVTKKGTLIDLNTFFNFALKKGWAVTNPCKLIEKIEVEQYARGIVTPMQADILIRTCAASDAPLVRYFSDQMFGGLREIEARQLTKAHEHKLHIELPGDDVYEPGFIEWNPTWKAWRDKYPGEYYPIRNFWRRVSKIKNAAKAKMIESKVADEAFWFPRNCLRHSFCSYGSKVWGTGKTAELARHSEAMQKKHYRRPIPLEDAKAFWAINP